MQRIIYWAVGTAVLLGGTPLPAHAGTSRAPALIVDTHRCTDRGDYCIVVQHNSSTRRVPLIIAHKVSGVKNHTYWAQWSHKKPGHSTWTSGWKRSTWTGDNGRAPGVAVETLWGRKGRFGGPKLPRGTVLCTQFKGSDAKACYRLG